MNISISHNWLLEYIDTKASPYDIQKYLSLCGPSVEKVDKIADDYIYDIEITSNRIDTASVYGIAREAAAILNRFNIKTKLKPINLIEPKITTDNLTLHISDPDHLCPRILAVVIDNVKVGNSPKYIKDRLERCGIRSLNNLIDVTNYVMLELGHPTHVFDYDRIKTGKLILRKAKKGEKLVTLDDKEYVLNEDDVVIDDGTGRIIDLPGIMGTANSVVTPQTKRIIFFIESNNPFVIRKTSMRLSIRSLAATYNEKQPDSEMAKLAFLRGINLFEQLSGGKVASKLYDIYPKPYESKTVSIATKDINKIIGVKIDKKDVLQILTNLGFIYHSDHDREKMVTVKVPSYRAQDINIKEDLIEEIARIYGYFNLPNNLPPVAYVRQPKDMELMFSVEHKIKNFLKHLGLHEVINYSMISKQMIENSNLTNIPHLELKNTISEDIKYMRRHLMPSLIKNIKDNEGKENELRFFEITKTYKPRINDLPIEEYKLGIVINTDFFDLKGIIDALLRELNINDYEIEKSDHPLLSENCQGKIIKNKERIGEFGRLKNIYKVKNGLKNNIFLGVFDLKTLIKNAKYISTYKQINPFAIIKLDLTIAQNPKSTFQEIKSIAYKRSKYLYGLELLDKYKDKITLRFYFSDVQKNITEEEAIKELDKIKEIVI